MDIGKIEATNGGPEFRISYEGLARVHHEPATSTRYAIKLDARPDTFPDDEERDAQAAGRVAAALRRTLSLEVNALSDSSVRTHG